MTVLGDAIEAANARKAAIGLPESHSQIVFSESQSDDRAVFSGFDIDYDELVNVVETAGAFFTMQACGEHPLIPLFRAAWSDGFLTGLMVRNNVAPHHESPGSDNSRPESESGGTPTEYPEENI